MASVGFDELVDFLLDKIALSGSKGGSSENILQWCQEFYSVEAPLRNNKVVATGQPIITPTAPNNATIDSTLHRKVWEWLVSHPDVNVEKRVPQAPSENVGARDGELQPHDAHGVISTPKPVAGLPSVAGFARSKILKDLDGLYLTTTEERVWYSLTGHGPDFTKVKGLELQILSIIASHGPRGVVQPDLFILTGQDKRSLPGRTDALHEKGYIEKKPVLAHGTRTSLCTLARFLPKSGANGVLDDDDCFRDGMLISDKFYDKAMRIIKEYGLITQTDFRRRMNCTGKPWQSRAAFRNLRRMDQLGCIKRVKATGVSGPGKKIYVRCIKYIGEPGEQKRQELINFSGPDIIDQEEDENEDSDEENEIEEADDLENQDGTEAVVTLQNGLNSVSESLTSTSLYAVPQLDLEQPTSNYLYDLIESSGPQGMSSMDVQALAFGKYFKRPTEQLMSRLTDIWQESQPPHLRHFGIIRDAAVVGKYSHYIYRTYDNFAAAVELNETSWEAINSAYEKTKSLKKAVKQDVKLDDWGFPEIPAKRFVKSGPATMEACRLHVSYVHQDTSHSITFAQDGSASIKKPRGRPKKSYDEDSLESTPRIKKPLGRPKKIRNDAGSLVAAPVVKKPRGRPKKTDNTGDGTSGLKKPKGRLNKSLKGKGSTGSNNTAARASPEQLVPAMEHTLSNSGLLSETAEVPPAKRIRTAVGIAPWDLPTSLSTDSDHLDHVHETRSIPNDDTSLQRAALINTGVSEHLSTKGTKRGASEENDNGSASHFHKRQKILAAKGLADSPAPVHSFLPGVYRNPPRRINAIGRPRKSLLLVFKSTRLEGLGWFRVTQKSDRTIHMSTPPLPELSGELSALVQTPELTPATPEITMQTPMEVQEPEIANRLASREPAMARGSGILGMSKQDLDDTLKNAFAAMQALNQVHVDIIKPRDQKDNAKDTHELPEVEATAPEANNTTQDSLPVDTQEKSGVPVLPMTSHAEWLYGKVETSNRKPQYRKRQGVTLGKGVVEFKKSKIILDIMTEADGVYPGDREIWFPFTTVTQRTNPTTKPDVKTVLRAVKNVMDSGRLKKFAFAFKTKSGIITTKHILALPHIGPKSTVVKDLERKIIEAENNTTTYLPSKPEIDPLLRKRAEKLVAFGPKGKNKELPVEDTIVERMPSDRPPKAKPKPAWAAWAVWADSIKHGTGNADVDTSDEESSEVISEEQASMQAMFQLSNYAHISTQPAQKRRLGRLSSLARLGDGKKPIQQTKLRRLAGTSHDRRFGRRAHVDPYSLPSSGLSWQPVDVVEVCSPPREHQGLMPLSSIIPILGPSPNSHGILEHWKAQYATLTRPVQTFYRLSGTFATDFVAPRKLRPQLKIQPHLLRSFEDKLPKSIEGFADPHAKDKRALNYLAQIDREIKQVERWEKSHEEVLTSKMQLVTPRFINYNLTRDPRPAESEAVLVPVTNEQVPVHKTVRSIGGMQLPSGSRSVLRFKTKDDSGISTAKKSQQSPKPRVVKAASKRVRKFRSAAPFSEAQSQRFIAVVLVVRTLLGGVDRAIDWTLVQRLLPGEFSSSLLKKRWTATQSNCRLQLAKMDVDFQENYLKAVEEWHLPMIDYDDVENYNWEQIVDWAQVSMQVPAGDSLPELPARREVLEEYFDVVPEKDVYELSKEELYVGWATQMKREEVLGDTQASLQIGSWRGAGGGVETTTDGAEENKFEVAKSYVRANILTPAKAYHPQAARAKLTPLGTDMLDKALSQLLTLKVLKVENKGRLVPGRNYAPNDQFVSGLKKGSLDVDTFLRPAVRYKASLDTELAQHGTVIVPPSAPDGHVLAILNLVATNYVNLTLDIPPVTDMLPGDLEKPDATRGLSIWGSAESNYKTKQFDRDCLQFTIRLSMTDDYRGGIPMNPSFPQPPGRHLNGDAEHRIPLWYDIHDNVLPMMWEIMLSIVVTATVLRPGVTAEEISKACKNCVAVFEAEWTLAWLNEVGVVRRLGMGWIASEWWWCLFGAASKDEDDVAAAMLEFAKGSVQN